MEYSLTTTLRSFLPKKSNLRNRIYQIAIKEIQFFVFANETASGNPTYPSPITAIVQLLRSGKELGIILKLKDNILITISRF